MKDFVKNNKYIILTIIGGFVIVLQSFFLYLSTEPKPSRNLLIVQKSPYRIVARWDSFKNEDTDLELAKMMQDERELWYQYAFDVPFEDYKFNENLYIKVDTTDIKSDSADIKINEKESITDSQN